MEAGEEVQLAHGNNSWIASNSVVVTFTPEVPTLATRGNCSVFPGVSLEGFSADGSVALLWSTRNGSNRVHGGACGGTAIDLATPATLRDGLVVDESGDRVLSFGSIACGSYVQAVDLSTCVVSNVVAF